MTRTANLLTIGLVTFVAMACGAWRLAGLSPWVSLGIAAAFSTSTLAALMTAARSRGRRLRTRRWRAAFMVLLGLFIVACGLFAWYFTASKVASGVCVLSGMLYSGLGLLEIARDRQ